MDTYNNFIETEVITQCIEETFSSGSCCYKRYVPTEAHSKFEENEPPHTIGHGPNHIDDNHNISSQIETKNDDLDKKYKVLLNFEEAPEHLQFNPFIRTGYRTFLPTKFCLHSIFWWTNETINIWSHLLGYLLFVVLTIYDLQFLHLYADFSDKLICALLLVCFQLCMLLSATYHIFSCRSAKDYDHFLLYDLFGIALVLLAIYVSGVYYAFWCHESLRNFYTITIIACFVTAVVIQIPRLNFSANAKISVFLGWCIYGFVPLVHWVIQMGGFKNPLVELLVPRVIFMYALSGFAFVIYTTKFPERWFSGKVDFCGHSHNWWHLFILGALYHWHNTGIDFITSMAHYDCASNRMITFHSTNFTKISECY